VRPIILLDCDGPLAAFTQAYLRALWMETGYRVDVEEVDRWDIHECVFFKRIARERGIVNTNSLRELVDAHVVKPGFCADITPQPGAREAVTRLSEIGDVYIVTSPWDSSPTWMHERTQWVARHFPNIGRRRVIQTAQKHLIRGDVFVDDKASHVEEWAEAWPEGRPILFDMHHNRYPKAGTGLFRGGWKDAIEAAEAIASRMVPHQDHDLISHDLIELTPLNGVRRRLDVACLMILHGNVECRAERVTGAEADRLAREEALS
jgi:5'(3')-deoxyribonucleotidase